MHAQWRTQEITLNPGWNVVFLEIDPEPQNCATVLSGLPIESVRLYARRSAAPQFFSEPRQLTPQSPDWLVWVGDTFVGPALNTQLAMPGGRPYLIKLSGNQSVIWSIRGRPANRPQKYEKRAFNFFYVHGHTLWYRLETTRQCHQPVDIDRLNVGLGFHRAGLGM